SRTELPLGDDEQPERRVDGLAPAKAGKLACKLRIDEVEAPERVEIVEQRCVLRRDRPRDQDHEKAKRQILDEHRCTELLAAAGAPSTNLGAREELADLMRVVVLRTRMRLCPYRCHPDLDAAAIEQDAVAVHAGQFELL